MGRNDDLESEVICFECAQLVITSRDRNTKYGGYFDPSAVVLEAYLEESAWSAFTDKSENQPDERLQQAVAG